MSKSTKKAKTRQEQARTVDFDLSSAIEYYFLVSESKRREKKQLTNEIMEIIHGNKLILHNANEI